MDRWERTRIYNAQGWFTAADVNGTGQSLDFIQVDVYQGLLNNAMDAFNVISGQGYTEWTGAFNYAVERFKYEYLHPPVGICAKVTIRIEQRLVLSRSAFRYDEQ